MFEFRLAKGLGKTRKEIRQLPYPEFRRWYIFYLLEPWGWHDEEYRTAAIMSAIRNANVQKKRDLKSPKFFMRDMAKELLSSLQEELLEESQGDFDLETEEGKKAATEYVVRNLKETFGVK